MDFFSNVTRTLPGTIMCILHDPLWVDSVGRNFVVGSYGLHVYNIDNLRVVFNDYCVQVAR